MPPPLGFITPDERTQDQEDAHAIAVATMVMQFALPVPTLPKGGKIILTDAWEHPDVIADVGRPLIRELQNTGSCVKVGGTNALRVTIATQRLVSDNPTAAFEPFCWHNYAMSRHYMGSDGQGEGSLGSTFARSLNVDGVVELPQDTTDNLPDYKQTGEHINITAAQEMAWSSVRNPQVEKVLALSKAHPLGTAAVCRSTNDMKAMILNGYGGSFACDRYIGDASVVGEGENAYVKGKWDNQGGHQQWYFGYWEHPSDGPLFAVGNNWPDDTYPEDPAGLPSCCVWVKEADVARAMTYHGEVYGFSNLNWFPANPRTLDWLI